MSEEIQNETNSQENENQESVNQEELAAQWESEASSDVDQEDLAKQWEQDASQTNVDQDELAAAWESETQTTQDNNKDLDSSSFDKYEKSENSKLSLLMDIPLEVTVEIGSAELPIEEVLKLNPNSVIELDKMINEPVDLKVNGKLIAKGELYTVKNSFGIKITNIITPEDRMKILDKEL